jgi:hypothetical protein
MNRRDQLVGTKRPARLISRLLADFRQHYPGQTGPDKLGGSLHHSKMVECLLMRHVALLNLITQCKDNLKGNMDERNISRVSAKNRDHDGKTVCHELLKEGTSEHIEEND